MNSMTNTNSASEQISFTSVTEVTGNQVSREQLTRMYTRYCFASGYCAGKEVLEVACGTGQGLGMLASKALKVTGGDCDPEIVSRACANYHDAIEIKQLDAQALPFSAESFDVVILFEAIYYLSRPDLFLEEARRVLKEDGILIIGTANRDCPGFNPSPYSRRYYSAHELHALLRQYGFRAQLYADCPLMAEKPVAKITLALKKGAVKFNLMPKSMKGKEKLKRIFYGKLKQLPSELHEDLDIKYTAPVAIDATGPNREHKVIFAVAQLTD